MKHKSRYDIDKLPNKYTRVIISFNNGARLYFNDLRKFGWIKVISNIKDQILKLGPEPFSKEFTTEYLKKIFSKTAKAIKLVLIDQEKIAGIGNIYASEALFEAQILPKKPAKKLRELEIERLRDSIIFVLEKGIKYGGSSVADEAYRQVDGTKGQMQKHFMVYERKGKQCLRCKAVIKKIRLGGRGTYYCPVCQK